MFSENNLVLKPGFRMSSVGVRTKYLKGCISIGKDYVTSLVNCLKRIRDTTVSIETKARTPFFLSGPRFSLTMAEGSWSDVMITATRSEENSVTGANCLEQYNIYESIFKRSNLFSKSVPGVSRKDFILVNLVQSKRKRPVQIRIRILTRSKLLKTKPATTIDLNWTSVVSMSTDISRKTISLPGILKYVTLETLSFAQDNTINVHWNTDFFSRNFYKSYEGFCHKDILTTTKHNYCLNYTSGQNSYLFFWNFTQYLKCYYIPPLKWRNFWAEAGFTIPKNNKCPTQQSKGKVIKSWTEASKFCKSIGGTLPLLRNRDELDEIIAFLKLSKDMPPVEGLYIGIHRIFRSQVIHRVDSN